MVCDFFVKLEKNFCQFLSITTGQWNDFVIHNFLQLLYRRSLATDANVTKDESVTLTFHPGIHHTASKGNTMETAAAAAIVLLLLLVMTGNSAYSIAFRKLFSVP
ncbi:Hypothetical predicted protein [Octopus vulgaris]|uniref:Uncharacterized protein n=1 Tax=Octopus vulgaris TaxID=6645 RepID=A0AA36F3E7_OCTVU|nr:Hypothetical predicted protein [Octopus vulgaris]